MKNFNAGLELFRRIGQVADVEKHHPDLHLVDFNRVRVELTTHASKGLTENDFIMAAKINEIEWVDLQPKQKA